MVFPIASHFTADYLQYIAEAFINLTPSPSIKVRKLTNLVLSIRTDKLYK